MTQARIYRPAKTAMQSGRARTTAWVLEFEPEAARTLDPLMGWTSSRDMRSQVRLRFASRDDAIAYATRHGMAYAVEHPHDRAVKPKAYADNFAYRRRAPWTH